MKCLSCGKEASDDATFCKYCGYEFESKKPFFKKIEVKEDPIVPEEQKKALTDNPILTFIIGLTSIFSALLYFSYNTFQVIYFITSIVLIGITFVVGNKPAKLKYIPVRNFGKALAYISVFMVLLKTVYFILGIFI